MEDIKRVKGGFSPNGYTVGVGLTDRCNAECSHCYSRTKGDSQDLDRDLLLRLIDSIPIRGINLGTGESILYPDFVSALRMLLDKGIPIAITTNGSTIAELHDGDIRRLHDVDFSIDFPDREANDRWRGTGTFQAVINGARRCQDLGIEVSLVTCLMKDNSSHMGGLAELAASLALSLRVNVYKSVFTRKYQPSYQEFWGAIADMASTSFLTACSEPIVSAAIGNSKSFSGNPCGQKSFRIHPDGKIVACVYLKESSVTIDNLISDFDNRWNHLAGTLNLPMPDACRECPYLDRCRGGCASRRILGEPDQPDEYCFVIRGDQPRINARWKKSKGLVHEDYLCTMIFSG